MVVARENPWGRESVLHVDRAHTYAPATETALSTKVVPKNTTLTVPAEELISDSESGEDITGDSSESEEIEIDICMC